MTTPSTSAQGPVAGWTLSDLRQCNIDRQASWCPDQVPDLSFRGNELGGEVGEALNVIKKLERERHGWRGSRDTVEHLAEELADVVICADLAALTAGVDLMEAVKAKFDATSEKVGLPHRLTASQCPTASPSGVRVKPLEWEPKTGGCTATGLGINYAMGEEAPGLFCLYHPFHTGPMPKEQVQAAAQADYEARILSALASDATPAPEDGGDAVGITTHQVWLERAADRALQLGRRPTRAEILMCASDWQALAKPASEPAGGDVREAEFGPYRGAAERLRSSVMGALTLAVCDHTEASRLANYVVRNLGWDAALSSSAGPAAAWQTQASDGTWYEIPRNMYEPVRQRGFPVRALYAHPAPATVEISDAMIDAGCAAWVKLYPAFDGEKPQPTAGDVVKAILSAALAPATEGKKDKP